MGKILISSENTIKVSCISTDPKHGTWWAFGTGKQWLEIRTTKAGKIKVFEVKKGTHPYFTIQKGDLTNE